MASCINLLYVRKITDKQKNLNKLICTKRRVIDVAFVVASRTFCHEILIGFDECSDQRSWERSKPVFPVEISRDRAQDVVQEILLGVNRGSIAVVPVKQLQANDRAEKPGMPT